MSQQRAERWAYRKAQIQQYITQLVSMVMGAQNACQNTCLETFCHRYICLYLVKMMVFVFLNHGLEYQLMDQRTHAILIICAYKFQCEFVLLIPRNAHCNLCALFKHDSGWKNESSCGRIGRYIFCQCGFKSHHIKKIH